MNDMRKWINLVESTKEYWLSDDDLSDQFIPHDLLESWFLLLDTVPHSRQLDTVQNWFVENMKEEMKPAWITDMKIVRKHGKDLYLWKIKTGDNLTEAKFSDEDIAAGKWYSDQELRYELLSSGRVDDWFEEFDYAPKHEILFVAQDAFQRYVRWHLKPIWIADVQLPDENWLPRYRGADKIMWKIVRGEDDPDE